MKGYVLPSFGLFSAQTATSFGRIAHASLTRWRPELEKNLII